MKLKNAIKMHKQTANLYNIELDILGKSMKIIRKLLLNWIKYLIKYWKRKRIFFICIITTRDATKCTCSNLKKCNS